MGKNRTDWRIFILALLFLLCSALPGIWCGIACLRLRPARAARAGAVQAMQGDARKLVALTFDDGPRRSTTTALLDGLSQRGVHATFFLIGQNVDGNEDLVLRMDREGHQIGIHSYRHKMLTGLNAADFYAEVGALRERLEELVGHDSLLLRPPYGKIDNAVRRMAGCPIILWSIDPEDWSDEDTGRQVALITGQARDGDIILLHDIYPSSVETALRVVDELHAQGFYFTTIDELFAAKGLALRPGETYNCARD